MSILLIRHGETDLNATQVVQFPETPLGRTGLEQARQLGLSLAERQVDRIITSDYQRARTTAESIRQNTSAELHISKLLRERNFGELRGKAYDQFEGTDIFARDYHPPGGESWEQFEQRVDLAWSELRSAASNLRGDLAVVTHGLVLRSLLERQLDLNGFDIGEELVVANTSVTEVSKTSPWQVIRLACVAHLDSGPVAGGAV